MTDRFVELVQALPRELFDDILDLTFTLPGQQTVHITKSHQPLNLPAISRTTRQRFAAQYYSTTHFHSSSTSPLIIWLHRLPKAYLPLLSHVTLDLDLRGEDRLAWVKHKALCELEDILDSLSQPEFNQLRGPWLVIEVKGFGRWVLKDPGDRNWAEWVDEG